MLSTLTLAVTGVPVIPVVAVVIILLLAGFLFSIYKVAEPSEALLISGWGTKGSDDRRGYKVVNGGGAFVLPIVQNVRRLHLDQRSISLSLSSAVTSQSIPLNIRAVMIYKVADDNASISNAARRFLSNQENMDRSVLELSLGQLRSIVGSMTVEELISDREALRTKVFESCQQDMEKLGLHIDSFQIQEITDVNFGHDEPGYIENLGRPRAAEIAKNARIAEAVQTREAIEREAENQAQIAEATKDSEVRSAKAKAETEKAQALADQQGPLASAQARQEVIEANTRAAELEADLTEKQLQTQVRRPADAQAYEQVTLAEAAREAEIKAAQASAEATKLRAEADAVATTSVGEANASVTKLRGSAEAAATREMAQAQAEGIKARNEALETNSEAVINQQIAEKLPEIVQAAASQWNNVDTVTVLDGADGVSKALMGTISSVSTLLPAAQQFAKGLTAATDAAEIEQPTA